MSDPAHTSRKLRVQSLLDDVDPEKIQVISTDISQHVPPADAQELDEILVAMKDSDPTEDLVDISQHVPPADAQELKEILQAMASSRPAKKPKHA